MSIALPPRLSYSALGPWESLLANDSLSPSCMVLVDKGNLRILPSEAQSDEAANRKFAPSSFPLLLDSQLCSGKHFKSNSSPPAVAFQFHSPFESRVMKQWVTPGHKFHPSSHSEKQLTSFGFYEGDKKIQNFGSV